MKRIPPQVVWCSLLCLAGCALNCSHDASAHSPSSIDQRSAAVNDMPAEVSPLRAALSEVIHNDEEDAAHMRLVAAVLERRSLVGHTRAEITRWLGRGVDSSRMNLATNALV